MSVDQFIKTFNPKRSFMNLANSRGGLDLIDYLNATEVNADIMDVGNFSATYGQFYALESDAIITDDITAVVSRNGRVLFQGENYVAMGYYVGFKAPTLDHNTLWTLPPADGADKQSLTTDGKGNLYWNTAAGAGTVVGPEETTVNAVALWANDKGTVLANSKVIVDEEGEVSGVKTLTATGDIVTEGAITATKAVKGTDLILASATDPFPTITFKTADTEFTGYTLTFPEDVGEEGQVLVTNGEGILSWSSAGGDGKVTSVKALDSNVVVDPNIGEVVIGLGDALDIKASVAAPNLILNNTGDGTTTFETNSTTPQIWTFPSELPTEGTKYLLIDHDGVIGYGDGGEGESAVNSVENNDNNLVVTPNIGDVTINMAEIVQITTSIGAPSLIIDADGFATTFKSVATVDQTWTFPSELPAAGTKYLVIDSSGAVAYADGGEGGSAVNSVTSTDLNILVAPNIGEVELSLASAITLATSVTSPNLILSNVGKSTTFKTSATTNQTWTFPSALPDAGTTKYLTVSSSGTVSYGGAAGGGAPSDATYILQTPSAALPNAQSLNALSNGIMIKDTNGKIKTVDQITLEQLPSLHLTVVPEPTGFYPQVFAGTATGDVEASNVLGAIGADLTLLNVWKIAGSFIAASGIPGITFPGGQRLEALPYGSLLRTVRELEVNPYGPSSKGFITEATLEDLGAGNVQYKNRNFSSVEFGRMVCADYAIQNKIQELYNVNFWFDSTGNMIAKYPGQPQGTISGLANITSDLGAITFLQVDDTATFSTMFSGQDRFVGSRLNKGVGFCGPSKDTAGLVYSRAWALPFDAGEPGQSFIRTGVVHPPVGKVKYGIADLEWSETILTQSDSIGVITYGSGIGFQTKGTGGIKHYIGFNAPTILDPAVTKDIQWILPTTPGNKNQVLARDDTAYVPGENNPHLTWVDNHGVPIVGHPKNQQLVIWTGAIAEGDANKATNSTIEAYDATVTAAAGLSFYPGTIELPSILKINIEAPAKLAAEQITSFTMILPDNAGSVEQVLTRVSTLEPALNTVRLGWSNAGNVSGPAAKEPPEQLTSIGTVAVWNDIYGRKIGNSSVKIEEGDIVGVTKYGSSVLLTTNGKLEFKYIGFRAPNTALTNLSWILPEGIGSDGEVLMRDGISSIVGVDGQIASLKWGAAALISGHPKNRQLAVWTGAIAEGDANKATNSTIEAYDATETAAAGLTFYPGTTVQPSLLRINIEAPIKLATTQSLSYTLELPDNVGAFNQALIRLPTLVPESQTAKLGWGDVAFTKGKHNVNEIAIWTKSSVEASTADTIDSSNITTYEALDLTRGSGITFPDTGIAEAQNNVSVEAPLKVIPVGGITLVLPNTVGTIGQALVAGGGTNLRTAHLAWGDIKGGGITGPETTAVGNFALWDNVTGTKLSNSTHTPVGFNTRITTAQSTADTAITEAGAAAGAAAAASAAAAAATAAAGAASTLALAALAATAADTLIGAIGKIFGGDPVAKSKKEAKAAAKSADQAKTSEKNASKSAKASEKSASAASRGASLAQRSASVAAISASQSSISASQSKGSSEIAIKAASDAAIALGKFDTRTLIFEGGDVRGRGQVNESIVLTYYGGGGSGTGNVIGDGQGIKNSLSVWAAGNTYLLRDTEVIIDDADNISTPGNITFMTTSSEEGGGDILLTLASGATETYTFTLPMDGGVDGNFLQTDGNGNTSWVSAIGTGTITEIKTGANLVGGPITTTGTIALDTKIGGLESIASKSITYNSSSNNGGVVIKCVDDMVGYLNLTLPTNIVNNGYLQTDEAGILKWNTITSGNGNVIGKSDSSGSRTLAVWSANSSSSLANTNVRIDASDNLSTGGTISATSLVMRAGVDSSKKIYFVGGSAQKNDLTLTFPSTIVSGGFLSTDSLGNLSWAQAGTGDGNVVGRSTEDGKYTIPIWADNNSHTLANSGVRIEDGNIINSGDITVNNVIIPANDNSNNNYTLTLTKSDTEQTKNLTLKFPANTGNSGQVLATDGDGNLYWTTVQGSTNYIVGPGISTVNAIATWGTKNGAVVKNSSVTIDPITQDIITPGIVTCRSFIFNGS